MNTTTPPLAFIGFETVCDSDTKPTAIECAVTVVILIGILVCDHAESPTGKAMDGSTIGAMVGTLLSVTGAFGPAG